MWDLTGSVLRLDCRAEVEPGTCGSTSGERQGLAWPQEGGRNGKERPRMVKGFRFSE